MLQLKHNPRESIAQYKYLVFIQLLYHGIKLKYTMVQYIPYTTP